MRSTRVSSPRVRFNAFISFARRFGAFHRRARLGRLDSSSHLDAPVDMPDAELDDRDCLTRFAAHHRDVFNKEILSKMKTPRRACPCGRANEVPSCRIHYAVLRCVNRTFRKLLPPYEEVMAKKNEVREWDRVTGRQGVSKSELQRYVCMHAAPKLMEKTIRARDEAGDRLWWAVKETLDDMAAGRDNPKYECEACGKFVCVFCGAACACPECNDVRTCRECAETYENFTFCESCKLAYCNDGDEYDDESDCDKDIVYCSECDRFRCSDDCQNVLMFCEICSDADPFCLDCTWRHHVNCDGCGGHLMCEGHNEVDEYLTYVGDDDDQPEGYWYLCDSCLNPRPWKPPIEKPPRKAPIKKPRSPSVSPRMSFSSCTDDID